MRVLLFSDFGLPDSCAASTRVMNIAKILKELGHDVDLLGVSYKQDEPLYGCCGSISFRMIRAPFFTGAMAFKRIRRIKKDLEEYLNNRSYNIVLLSNVYYDYSDVFFRYSKKTDAKIVVNAVEWYDVNNAKFAGLFGFINLIKNRIALRFLHVKMNNILAISSLLEEFYKKCGCNTITIPTIIDPEEYRTISASTPADANTVKIAYAGSPAKKDYILNAVYAVGLLTDEERKRLELHLYGPKVEQLIALGVSEAYLEEYKSCIICHGRIPYEQVKEKVVAADYTVLLRPNRRYANAGFPTKVGESMACGTPVIANHTSDLHRYILDGKTGIVCKDESAQSCAAAFRRALALSEMEKNDMRLNALQMAQNYFDYKNYLDPFATFLEKCHAK